MQEERHGLVFLIGLFKLAKALLLIAAGLAALKLVRDHGDAQRLAEWANLSPAGRFLQRGVAKLQVLRPAQLQAIAFGTFAYAGIFLVEGAGLLARRRWAEWLTVIVTTSFIPLEIWEIARHGGAGKIATLVLNVAIVIYLIARIRSRRR